MPWLPVNLPIAALGLYLGNDGRSKVASTTASGQHVYKASNQDCFDQRD